MYCNTVCGKNGRFVGDEARYLTNFLGEGDQIGMFVSLIDFLIFVVGPPRVSWDLDGCALEAWS